MPGSRVHRRLDNLPAQPYKGIDQLFTSDRIPANRRLDDVVAHDNLPNANIDRLIPEMAGPKANACAPYDTEGEEQSQRKPCAHVPDSIGVL
jgi:hypothetical protein